LVCFNRGMISYSRGSVKLAETGLVQALNPCKIYAMDVSELLSCINGKAFKLVRDMSDTESVLRAIVNFSNDSGGVLLIGMDDNHSVIGLRFPWHDEERLSTLIRDSICPEVNPLLELLPCKGKQMLRVTVYPGSQPPYGLSAKKHVAIGVCKPEVDADRAASPKYSIGLRFDETPMDGLDSDALDVPGAIELFAPRRLSLQDLVSMRILTDCEGKLVPTVGGFLLFGRDRETHFPDVWLQCGRFQGHDKALIMDTMEFRDHLPLLPIRAMEFLRKHSNTSYHIEGVHREERSNLPLVALREGVVNALVHADYAGNGSPVRLSVFDDHIEIENSGVLLAGIAMADILKGVSVLRNRVIGRVFKELGLIEQWGSGIHRMFMDCERMGLPVPRFQQFGNHFRLIVNIRGDGSNKTNEPSLRLRRLLTEDSPDS